MFMKITELDFVCCRISAQHILSRVEWAMFWVQYNVLLPKVDKKHVKTEDPIFLWAKKNWPKVRLNFLENCKSNFNPCWKIQFIKCGIMLLVLHFFNNQIVLVLWMKILRKKWMTQVIYFLWSRSIHFSLFETFST